MAKRSKQTEAPKRTVKTDPRLDDVVAQLAKALERITAVEEHLKGTPIPWVEPEESGIQTAATAGTATISDTTNGTV